MKSAAKPLESAPGAIGRILWGRSLALGVAGTALTLVILPLGVGKQAPTPTSMSAPIPVTPLDLVATSSTGDAAAPTSSAARPANPIAQAAPPAARSTGDVPIADPFTADPQASAATANNSANPAAAPKPAASPAAKAADPSPKTAPPTRPAPNRQNMFWMEQAPQRALNLKKDLPIYAQIFQSPTALGVVAVGVAEGNYRLTVQNGALFVQPTPNYYGHTDPGNLSWGQRVTNYGPCSDQGRSGGNLAAADRSCVERLTGRLPTALTDMYAAGIDPYDDLQALINAVDLYNQASPIHSRWFPQALTIARRGGLSGLEAYAWARTASFYLDSNDRLDIRNGTNRASGLLGICSREGRPVTQWECVYADQARRVGAIASTYQSFLKLATNKSRRN